MLAVSQSSPGCQLSVTPLLQNQVGDIVMRESSSGTTDDKTVGNLDFSVSSEVKRLENMLKKLSALVLSLTARFDGSILAESLIKILELKHAKESQIRSAINKRIESFELNKSHTIRNMLKHSFHKVTLDYLVVNGKLVLAPNLVKTKIDVIIEE
ncbi:hypothetical protein G9A89_018848 [Geosiphon pyriformis]|nr:hypothetical protein G9A89_018848 [Geosiphon pyriformis]